MGATVCCHLDGLLSSTLRGNVSSALLAPQRLRVEKQVGVRLDACGITVHRLYPVSYALCTVIAQTDNLKPLLPLSPTTLRRQRTNVLPPHVSYGVHAILGMSHPQSIAVFGVHPNDKRHRCCTRGSRLLLGAQ